MQPGNHNYFLDFDFDQSKQAYFSHFQDHFYPNQNILDEQEFHHGGMFYDPFNGVKLGGNGEDLIDMAFQGVKRGLDFSKVSSRKSSANLEGGLSSQAFQEKELIPQLEQIDLQNQQEIQSNNLHFPKNGIDEQLEMEGAEEEPSVQKMRSEEEKNGGSNGIGDSNSEQEGDTVGEENINNGRWSSQEHHRFMEALHLYGKNWNMVHKHVGTRSSAQTRSHAQKYFNKLQRKGTKEAQQELEYLNRKDPKKPTVEESTMDNSSSATNNKAILSQAQSESKTAAETLENQDSIFGSPQSLSKKLESSPELQEELKKEDSFTQKEEKVFPVFKHKLSTITEKSKDIIKRSGSFLSSRDTNTSHESKKKAKQLKKVGKRRHTQQESQIDKKQLFRVVKCGQGQEGDMKDEEESSQSEQVNTNSNNPIKEAFSSYQIVVSQQDDEPGSPVNAMEQQSQPQNQTHLPFYFQPQPQLAYPTNIPFYFPFTQQQPQMLLVPEYLKNQPPIPVSLPLVEPEIDLKFSIPLPKDTENVRMLSGQQRDSKDGLGYGFLSDPFLFQRDENMKDNENDVAFD